MRLFLFFYIFSYIFNEEKIVFKDFVKEILGIDDFKGDYRILREEGGNDKNSRKKGRIDLLIENEDSVIIIENKIKASINDEKSNGSGKKESQLSKYVQQVYEKYNDKKAYFYIFAPDYNKIDLDNYEDGEKYKIINYSQIYNFYFKNAGKMLNIKYFKEFLNGIYIHTMTADKINFEKMKNKFIKNIIELRED